MLGGLETSLRTRTQGEILEMKAWLRTSSEWGVGWDLWQVDLSEAAASSSQRCSWIHSWVALPPGSTRPVGPHPWPQVGRMGRRVSTSDGCVKSGAQYLWLVEFDSKFSNRSIPPRRQEQSSASGGKSYRSIVGNPLWKMALCEMNAHKMLVKAIDSLSVESTPSSNAWPEMLGRPLV